MTCFKIKSIYVVKSHEIIGERVSSYRMIQRKLCSRMTYLLRIWIGFCHNTSVTNDVFGHNIRQAAHPAYAANVVRFLWKKTVQGYWFCNNSNRRVGSVDHFDSDAVETLGCYCFSKGRRHNSNCISWHDLLLVFRYKGLFIDCMYLGAGRRCWC